jgi:hypothetical protein
LTFYPIVHLVDRGDPHLNARVAFAQKLYGIVFHFFTLLGFCLVCVTWRRLCKESRGALLEKNIAVCYNEANRTQQGEKRGKKQLFFFSLF